MAVAKTILRNLVEVKLARLELWEPAEGVARRIYSVSTPGPQVEVRYFPTIAEAEFYFFEQVRRIGGRDWPPLFARRGAAASPLRPRRPKREG